MNYPTGRSPFRQVCFDFYSENSGHFVHCSSLIFQSLSILAKVRLIPFLNFTLG